MKAAIPAESFSPVLLSVHYPDGWHHVIACNSRIFKAGPTNEKGKGQVLASKGEWHSLGAFDAVLFPLLIELPLDSNLVLRRDRGAGVYIGVSGDDRNWTVSKPEAAGITTACAQAALSEVWRCIKSAALDMVTMQPRIDFSTAPLFEYKNASPLWRMNAWIRWDWWHRRGLNIPQRAAELRALGFSVTAKALERAADNRGMTRLPKD